jgi:hypothetical protein
MIFLNILNQLFSLPHSFSIVVNIEYTGIYNYWGGGVIRGMQR